jgi:hypothetical protein
MQKLFIIGNGFDLAHGLKTSYIDFLTDLEINVNKTPDEYSDILRSDFIETKHIGIQPEWGIFKNKILGYLSKGQIHEKWCDIELFYFQLLLELDKSIRDRVLPFNSPLEINIDLHRVKKYLQIYLVKEQEKFKELDAINYLFSTYNSHQTLVLNFNYTNTVSKYLEKYTNIQQINIHGELNNELNPIIFGFAASDEESKLLIDKNDNEYMRNIKKLNYRLTNNDQKLKTLMNDFSTGIDIFILGHSCGISDRLILSQIFNHKKSETILPFYFKDREGYLQTMINIDRIIDDYSKSVNNPKSFHKLRNFPHCTSMIQHNSGREEIEAFKEFVRNMDANKYSPI